MAKLLIVLILSTLFISTVTFILVLFPDAEPQEVPQAEKGPNPVAVLGPQIQGVSVSVKKIGSDLSRLSTSLKAQLTELDSRVKALDSKVTALSEPIEEEPAENTGDRKFEASEASEAPEDE